MSITLENCGIFREDILEGVVNQLVESLDASASNEALRLVRERVEKVVNEKVETIVSDAIADKVNELMAAEIQPLTVWGERRGDPRTINDILEASLKEFWDAKVDANGKATDRYGVNTTRIEYMVKKVAAEVLTDKTKTEFNQLILSAKTALSDALTQAVKDVTDAHLEIKRGKR